MPRAKQTSDASKSVDRRVGKTSRVGSGTKQEKNDGSVDIFLTEVEMVRMDYLVLKQQSVQKDMEATQLVFEGKQKDIRILQLEAELLQVKLGALQRDKDQAKAKSMDYVSRIKKSHGISKDKWGYDPDTGKVTLED